MSSFKEWTLLTEMNCMLYLYHVNSFAYHKLDHEMIIGRTTGDLLFANDAAMSGKHAKVTIENGAVIVEDLGSKNLTMVNHSQIQSNVPIKIKLYTLIEIGSQQFIVSDTNNISIETLNSVLDLVKSKPVNSTEKTKTNIEIKTIDSSLSLDSQISNKEKMITQTESDLTVYIENANKEMEKLNALKEEIVSGLKLKKDEASKKITVLTLEVENLKAEALRLKTELEIKKKKIINIKDIVD